MRAKEDVNTICRFISERNVRYDYQGRGEEGEEERKDENKSQEIRDRRIDINWEVGLD
jgi:hypothetical protein